MTAKEIRIEAAKIIANNEVVEEKDGIKTKRLIPLTPQDIAKEVGVTIENLVLALARLHVPKGLEQSKSAQESRCIYVMFDENCKEIDDGIYIPRAYSANRNTQKYLDKPF